MHFFLKTITVYVAYSLLFLFVYSKIHFFKFILDNRALSSHWDIRTWYVSRGWGCSMIISGIKQETLPVKNTSHLTQYDLHWNFTQIFDS